MKPLIAVLGPTATGKSALGIALAERFDGEIINCDSTAVYRGFDIGTDKVPVAERRGIPHHLIDIADPTDEYTAAQFARDAAAVDRATSTRAASVPILVGGTGFYYRALTRGLFPGPGKDAELRDRLERIAERRGVESCSAWCGASIRRRPQRILPRDRKRLVRALEVYFQTGRPLTAHFAETVSPLDAGRRRSTRDRAAACRAAVARRAAGRRVDAQFAAGCSTRSAALLAAACPHDARPFGGLVYRQVMEYLHGVRDEAATRALIAQRTAATRGGS